MLYCEPGIGKIHAHSIAAQLADVSVLYCEPGIGKHDGGDTSKWRLKFQCLAGYGVDVTRPMRRHKQVATEVSVLYCEPGIGKGTVYDVRTVALLVSVLYCEPGIGKG